MAQVPTGGNYVVDNSTGANVRADINEIYDAILTMNSGAAEPPYRQAYTFWADTGNNLFKMRNTANDGWIELFKLDGTFTLEDGSASTPALAFRDDLDTGIYSDAANTFNVATGGVERMQLGSETVFNETGVDVDFRIEGDTDTTLFVADAGNDRIGIGTSSPTSKLDIAGDVTITSTRPKLFLTDTNSASDYSLQNANGNIEFVDETNSATRMRIVSTGDATFTSVAGNASFTFKKGNAPIGEQSVSVKFDRNGTVIGGVGAPTQITGVSGNDMGIAAVNGGNIRFGTGSGGSATNRVSVDTTGDMTIHDGDLVIGTSGHGIDFSATGDSAGSTSDEILADYEKGSWTPVFSDASSSGNTASSYNVQKGWYARMGDLVNVFMRISNATFSGFNTSHAVFITGLPFTIQADVGRLCTGHAMMSNVNLDGDTMTIGILANPGSVNTSHFRFFQTKDNAVWGQIVVSQFTSGNNEIMINFSYLTP